MVAPLPKDRIGRTAKKQLTSSMTPRKIIVKPHNQFLCSPRTPCLCGNFLGICCPQSLVVRMKVPVFRLEVHRQRFRISSLSVLGGSWLGISRVISRITIVITYIKGLITPLITSHEPPSRVFQVQGAYYGCVSTASCTPLYSSGN